MQAKIVITQPLTMLHRLRQLISLQAEGSNALPAKDDVVSGAWTRSRMGVRRVVYAMTVRKGHALHYRSLISQSIRCTRASQEANNVIANVEKQQSL